MTLDHLTPNIYGVDAFEARVLERFASRADILEATGGDQVLNPKHPLMVDGRVFK